MKKEENIVNFDLSKLTLSELISLYEKVNEFTQFLSTSKIEEESKREN